MAGDFFLSCSFFFFLVEVFFQHSLRIRSPFSFVLPFCRPSRRSIVCRLLPAPFSPHRFLCLGSSFRGVGVLVSPLLGFSLWRPFVEGVRELFLSRFFSEFVSSPPLTPPDEGVLFSSPRLLQGSFYSPPVATITVVLSPD